jgi:hypothetical protein
MTATVGVGGVAGNPVTFSATAATQIGITQQPPGSTTLGTNFTVTVQLRNSSGGLAPASNVPLTIAIASGGGTLNGTTVVNTALGTATFTVNITGSAGARTLQISGAGVGNVVTSSITVN